MPKIKSRSSVQKRFKKTGKGKLKRGRAFTSHMFSNKSQKQKRHLRKSSLVSGTEAKKMSKMM
ncbi:MAG: 50S ribosomal protein L35 [Mycoplasmatales bacterium]